MASTIDKQSPTISRGPSILVSVASESYIGKSAYSSVETYNNSTRTTSLQQFPSLKQVGLTNYIHPSTTREKENPAANSAFNLNGMDRILRGGMKIADPVSALQKIHQRNKAAQIRKEETSKESTAELSDNASEIITPSIQSQSFLHNQSLSKKTEYAFYANKGQSPTMYSGDNHRGLGHHDNSSASLISKNKQMPIDKVDTDKLDYLRAIGDYSASAMKKFDLRDKSGCVEAISHVIRCALSVHDFDILKKAHNLIGYIFVHFGDPENALINFKQLRDIAEEQSDMRSKMYSYKQMGLCYQQLRMYDNALKCFKKQLELSWELNDVSNELTSYDNIGLQYYYLGDLDKARYYHDRMMRGKCEDKESIVRKINNTQFTNKKKERSAKKSDSVGDVHNIYAGFKSLMQKDQHQQFNTLTKRISSERPLKLVPSSRKETSDVDVGMNTLALYKAMQLERGGPVIRPGTPISEVSNSAMPSPRGEAKGKTINLLPHYREATDDTIQDTNSKNFGKRAASSIARFNPVIGFINKNKKNVQTFIVNKMERKSRKERVKQRLKPEFLATLPQFDKKELLRKAKISKQQQPNHFISLNHMSPSRNLKNYKRLEELNRNRTLVKFEEFQLELQEDLHKASAGDLQQLSVPNTHSPTSPKGRNDEMRKKNLAYAFRSTGGRISKFGSIKSS